MTESDSEIIAILLTANAFTKWTSMIEIRFVVEFMTETKLRHKHFARKERFCELLTNDKVNNERVIYSSIYRCMACCRIIPRLYTDIRVKFEK